MKYEDLVQGNIYKVVGNRSAHTFDIGQHVIFRGPDAYDAIVGKQTIICDELDKSDYWYMFPDELEEIH